MVIITRNLSASLLIILTISACSYFPDKEKDYQLTSAIAPLTLPEDLSAQKGTNTDIKTLNTQDEELTDKSEDIERKENVSVDLGRYSDETALIRIGEGIQRSWRVVGKALSHHSIEITDRDELESIYFVQYDPDFKKVEDGSLWDEFLFIFGSDPANDKQFGVKLVENGVFTELIVLDYEKETVSEGAGLKLLHLLYRTIKEDLSN